MASFQSYTSQIEVSTCSDTALKPKNYKAKRLRRLINVHICDYEFYEVRLRVCQPKPSKRFTAPIPGLLEHPKSKQRCQKRSLHLYTVTCPFQPSLSLFYPDLLGFVHQVLPGTVLSDYTDDTKSGPRSSARHLALRPHTFFMLFASKSPGGHPSKRRFISFSEAATSLGSL